MEPAQLCPSGLCELSPWPGSEYASLSLYFVGESLGLTDRVTGAIKRGILQRELTPWVRISGEMRPSPSPGPGARAWDRVRSRQARPWPTWAPWAKLAQPTAKATNHRPGSAQGSPQGLSGQGGAGARQEGGVANTTRPVPKALRPLE